MKTTFLSLAIASSLFIYACQGERQNNRSDPNESNKIFYADTPGGVLGKLFAKEAESCTAKAIQATVRLNPAEVKILEQEIGKIVGVELRAAGSLLTAALESKGIALSVEAKTAIQAAFGENQASKCLAGLGADVNALVSGCIKPGDLIKKVDDKVIENNLLILKKGYREASIGESVGGNAGAFSTGVNMVIDAKTGEIIEIGTFQMIRPEVFQGVKSGKYLNVVIRETEILDNRNRTLSQSFGVVFEGKLSDDARANFLRTVMKFTDPDVSGSIVKRCVIEKK